MRLTVKRQDGTEDTHDVGAIDINRLCDGNGLFVFDLEGHVLDVNFQRIPAGVEAIAGQTDWREIVVVREP